MRFLKIILSVFALFYRSTPNYLIISDVYFLRGKVNSAWGNNGVIKNNQKRPYVQSISLRLGV